MTTEAAESGTGCRNIPSEEEKTNNDLDAEPQHETARPVEFKHLVAVTDEEEGLYEKTTVKKEALCGSTASGREESSPSWICVRRSVGNQRSPPISKMVLWQVSTAVHHGREHNSLTCWNSKAWPGRYKGHIPRPMHHGGMYGLVVRRT